jgi:hypothetical protein
MHTIAFDVVIVFLNQIFSLSLRDKHNVIISKADYESIFFLELIHFLK